MTMPSLMEGYDDFDLKIEQIQDEVTKEVKNLARGKIGKIKEEALINEAVQIVNSGFEEFKKRINCAYTVKPWSSLAIMTINSLKNSYFYNHNHLLGQVKKILSGQEGR